MTVRADPHAPDRQSRRDRVADRPHRAADGHRAPSQSSPMRTRARCTWRLGRPRPCGSARPAPRELSRHAMPSSMPRWRAGPMRSIRATASSSENATFAEACRSRVLSSLVPRCARSAPWDKGRAPSADGGTACSRSARAITSDDPTPAELASAASLDRLSGSHQGLGRWRRQGHAGGRGSRGLCRRARSRRGARRPQPSAMTGDPRAVPAPARARRSAGLRRWARPGRAISSTGTARCSAATRRSSRRRRRPAYTRASRARMREAAIACAKAVAYVGAGTVEFLVSTRRPVLLHGNEYAAPGRASGDGGDHRPRPRRVADPGGRAESLCRSLSAAIRANGHAIEVRICAEDPAQGFLPQTGRLTWLRWPRDMDAIRVDTGVRQGDEVSSHYDSLLAKIVAQGADRREALDRMAAALAGTEIAGITTNREFLAASLLIRRSWAASYDTGFVENRRRISSLRHRRRHPLLWRSLHLRHYTGWNRPGCDRATRPIRSRPGGT